MKDWNAVWKLNVLQDEIQRIERRRDELAMQLYETQLRCMGLARELCDEVGGEVWTRVQVEDCLQVNTIPVESYVPIVDNKLFWLRARATQEALWIALRQSWNSRWL